MGRAEGLRANRVSPTPTGHERILPEEGVFKIQEVTGFGARLVYLGHNTDVVALSVGRAREGSRKPAGWMDPFLSQPGEAAGTFCWQ